MEVLLQYYGSMVQFQEGDQRHYGKLLGVRFDQERILTISYEPQMGTEKAVSFKEHPCSLVDTGTPVPFRRIHTLDAIHSLDPMDSIDSRI